jgi:hypothetical protein
MRFRKMRIAWSVGCAIAFVLLIALWVRSYWRVEHILWNSKAESLCVSIYPGQVSIESINGAVLMPLGWSYVVFPISRDDSTSDDEPRTIFGFGWQTDDDSITAYIPFWFPALTCTVFGWFAIVPPPPVKRFSLRTLLIATTLVCILLGLVVYFSTRPPASPPLNVGDFDTGDF